MSREAGIAGPLRPSATWHRWLRRLPRRALDFVWDNPSAEHDARTILSSPKVGLWLGLEVLLLLAACAFAGLALPEVDDELRRLTVTVGVAPYLVASCLITLTSFLTLIVPLRASGLLEGPRWRGYLDQLVTTGVTPLRYYAGKWATSQPFFLALLGASVPFVVLCGVLGELSWGRTAVSYLVLYAYCNLLLLVALGLGAVLHEVVALLLTWLLFSTFLLLDFFPVPSTLAALTPIRFLIQPFVELVAGSDAPVVGPLYALARPLGLSLPWPLWALLVWCGLAAVLGVTCALGPLHTYAPGLNNFGAVVLPGDRRRAFLRRLRPFLTRRVELAFLFENRGPALVRWTLPLRCLQQVGLLSLVAAMLFTAVFDPTVLRQVTRPGIIALHGLASALSLLSAAFVFSSGRVDALQRFPVGRWAIPQVAFDAGALVCFQALLVLIHVAGFALGWEDLAQGRATWWSPMSAEEVLLDCSSNLGVLLAVSTSCFLVSKAIGTRLLGRGGVFLCTLAYLLTLLFIPLLASGVSDMLRLSFNPLLQRLMRPAFFLSLISPAAQMAADSGAIPEELAGAGWLLRKGFWFWHVPWLAVLVATVVASHRSLAREAAALADGGAGEGPPCAGCGSRRRVPAGWTLWGGLVATRLLGVARCVDCHAEHSPRTGHADPRTVFLVLGVRFLLLMLCCLLLGYGLLRLLL